MSKSPNKSIQIGPTNNTIVDNNTDKDLRVQV